MGKGFGRAFRMLGLDERNVGANFWKLYMFFFFLLPFSRAFISLTESCSFFTLHKLADSIVLDRQN